MLHFFDGDLGVCGSGQGWGAPETPEAALAVMDRYQIGKALVYDRAAMESGACDRFDRILAFSGDAGERLLPTISAVPPACGEMPGPDELVEIILASGIKGVRVWPDTHWHIFDPFNFGALLEPLQAHRIPVFVHISEFHAWTRRGGYREFREVAQAFPDLPLVLLWTGMRDGRYVLPLLDGCPNVMTDLTCVTHQFIEFVDARWGSGRLVFASHYPILDPGIYTTWVSHSGVAAESREDLAWRNLARLVEGIR